MVYLALNIYLIPSSPTLKRKMKGNSVRVAGEAGKLNQERGWWWSMATL